jgi:hypothetical protein
VKKIAILIFEITNNLGGILPSTINTCKGLEEAGYEPTVFHAEWKTRVYARPEGTFREVGYGLRTDRAYDRARMFADPTHTWLYKGRSPSLALREALSGYDGVILSNSIPSLVAKKMRDNRDWQTVLQHGKPMIAMVRDCHWSLLALHILPFRHLFQAFVGVHPAAFESLKTMPWKIACQVNPHDISLYKRVYEKNWDEVCITSWFKAWKHIDDIIRAVPFFKNMRLRVAGGGIEYNYMKAAMTNPDGHGKGALFKKKTDFYSWKEGDRSVREEWIGKSIWEVAEKSKKFRYEGFLLGRPLDNIQSNCGGLIDPSYHYKWGEHFNRVMIEAILHRSLPFVRPYGISDNAEGQGRIFGPDNAVMLPEKASPKRLAEIICSSMKDVSLRKGILKANKHKLAMFDRKRVAKEYIKLLEGRREGGLFGIQEGKLDEKTFEKADRLDLLTSRFPRIPSRFPREKRNND